MPKYLYLAYIINLCTQITRSEKDKAQIWILVRF